MWANAIVHAFPKIAVHTQHLIASRKLAPIEIDVSSPARSRSLSCNLYAVLSAVVVDVIERQKLSLSLTTTSAFGTAIRFKNRLSYLQLEGLSPSGLHAPVMLAICISRSINPRFITSPAICMRLAIRADVVLGQGLSLPH